MTLSASTNRNDYIASGSNATFPYTFRIFINTQILVYIDGVLKTLGVDYSVTGVGTDAGSVVFSSNPSANALIALVGNVTHDQGTDLPANDPFPSSAVEAEFDKLTRLSQQLYERTVRSLKFPTSSVLTEPTMPEGVAGKFLRWNSATTLENADAIIVPTGSLSVPSFTAGAVVFASGASALAQDATGLFYDDTLNCLIVGVPGATTYTANTIRRQTTFVLATDPAKSYLAIGAQVHGPADNSELGIPNGNERVAVSGYTFGVGGDNTVAHIGGDFGLIISSLDPGSPSNVQNYAVGVNVYNNVGDPGAANHRLIGIAVRLEGVSNAAHGTNAILVVKPVDHANKWYSGLWFQEDTMLGAAAGGVGTIVFNSSSPDLFITACPSDDVDGVAIRIVNHAFTQDNLELMKSGRVLVRRSTTSVSLPSHSFVESPTDGMYSPANGTIGFATGGVRRGTVSAAGLSVDALTATGSAGGKKVVCVDTATGILYASSTGVDCSN